MSVTEDRVVDDHMERRVERLEDSLWGANGQNGLRSQFAALRARINLALGLAGGAIGLLAARLLDFLPDSLGG